MDKIELTLAQNRNFRDASSAGIRPGRLYRMGKLFELDAQEREYLESLGITDVFDLRAESERQTQPDSIISGARYHHIDFSGGVLGLDHVIELYRKAAADPDHVDGLEYIRESYRTLPEVCSGELRRSLEIISEAEDPRILVHCAGGKDRTGFLVAVLLKIAGVPDKLILRDYLLSRKSPEAEEEVLERYVERFASYGIALPARVARPFLTVDSRSMEGMLDHISRKYGSLEGYLSQAVGISAARRARLRAWLTG